MLLTLIWVFVLTSGVVKCSYVSENYIIEEPHIDVPKASDTPFKVYWNVPTKQCRSKKIPFDNLLKKYLITYNKDDRFEGEHITIIYDGGFMPKILKSDGAKYTLKNGGLPQTGNLDLHLIAFRESVNRLIPDPNFNGVGVIDMENWRPIFRQHWSGLAPVVDLSLSIEKRQYWWWPTSWQKMEATKRFEDAARIFMEKTLSTAKQMRPKAVWGYYGYPYCFNMMSNNMVEHCSRNVKDENDRTYWLWAESTALYPSIYGSSSLSTFELKKLVSGRLTEANRVKLDGVLVMPYFSLTYTYEKDSSFLLEEEVDAVFETLQKKQASGLIIWGSSSDVNTAEKCNQLYKYVDSSFGPLAKKYIQKIIKKQEEVNSGDLKNDYENNLDDTIDTTAIPTTFSNKSQENVYTTKKYELSDSKTMNLNKNINSIANILSEKHSPVFSNNNNYSHNISIPENTTKQIIMSQNNPASNNWNEIIISSVNVSNPPNLSVVISVPEIDADYAQTINQRQKLKEYFYETDVSASDFKNNESEIWSIIRYNTSSELKENPERIKSEKYAGNSVIQDYVKMYNSSITINKTKSYSDNGRAQNASSKITNHTDDFKSESALPITLENTTYSFVKTTNNAEPRKSNIVKVDSEFMPATKIDHQLNTFQNVTDDRGKDIKSSNTTEIWSIKFYSEDSPDIKEQLNFYRTYPPIIEKTANLSDVLNYLVTPEKDFSQMNTSEISNHTSLDLKLLLTNNYSKDLSQNSTQNKQLFKSQTYIDTLPSEQNNISDFLKIKAESFNRTNPLMQVNDNDISLETLAQESNPINISIKYNDNDTGIVDNFQSKSSPEVILFSANDFFFDSETDPCGSTISITNRENKNQETNTSQHINKTVVKEKVNAENSIFTLPLQNDKKDDQIIKSTTDSSIDTKISIKDNKSNYITTSEKETKLSNISMNYNETSMKENFKSNGNLESTLFSLPENSSKIVTVPIENENLVTILRDTNRLLKTLVNNNKTEIKENVNVENDLFTITQSNKRDDQLNKSTTDSNIEAKSSIENNDSDYLIILAEEPLNISAKSTVNEESDSIQQLLPSEFFPKNVDYLITLTDGTTTNSTLIENKTNKLEDFKLENSSKKPTNYESQDTINQKDKLTNNNATPNRKATDEEEYDYDDYN